MWRSAHLAAAQDNLMCTFPCLLKLSPTNLEWPAPFFVLSLSSMYGVQFVTQKAILREDVPFIIDAAKGLECRLKLLGAKDTV